MTSWPTRDAICLDCRTALAAGAACPGGAAHRVESLREPAGREALLSEVWGPKPLRDSIRKAARAGSVGGGASMFDACSGCDVLDAGLSGVGEVIALAVLVAVVVFSGALIYFLIRAIRRSRKPKPNGARTHAAPLGHPTGRVGLILTGATARDPLTGAVGVGFGVELVHRGGWFRRPRAMLRDGATLGFDVALPSGERVRIPPGPCLIDRSTAREVRPSGGDVTRYLDALDPQRLTSDDLEPLPHDEIRHVALAPGDRIEVLGPLVPVADGATHRGGYRDAAPAVLVPVGIPRLRHARS